MSVTVLSLETEVPENALSQLEFNEAAVHFLNLDTSEAHLLQRISDGSGINKRHTVIADFLKQKQSSAFFESTNQGFLPKMGKRNELYKKHAPQLAHAACHKALKAWGGDYSAITHVISVSCTGMIAPGIEYLLIELLGLSCDVERLAINFMGCFGAFKGLAVAKALARENSKNRVLLVCTELCSLHLQNNRGKESLIANALFADGAAAAVLGMEPQSWERPLLEINSQTSFALEKTVDLMSWEADDHGFHMTLSSSIPKLLEGSILSFVENLIQPQASMTECSWAVHPGGKSILKAVEKGCSLQNNQLDASWRVLGEYGNMSSSTFLFVVKELLKKKQTVKPWVIGVGFGPGLSIEGLLLKKVG